MKINNIENIDKQFIWQDSVGTVTQYLGDSAGSRKLYVNIDKVPPFAFSTKYHSHSQQEEFFLILSGSGILRLNGEEFPVKQGDYIAKPAAQDIAHQFYNSGTEELEILDVGTVEKEDTCYYPDEGIYLHKSNGDRKVFSQDTMLVDWSSYPNEK